MRKAVAQAANNFVDTRGRAVDTEAVLVGGVSYGYYLWGGDLADSPFPNQCGPLRPGVMVLGPGAGQQVITCAGEVEENHLPDVFLVDPAWKRYVSVALQLFVLVLVALIFKQAITKA